MRATPAIRESLSALVDRARTETQVHLRTAVKDALRAFRERLDPDDQMLLLAVKTRSRFELFHTRSSCTVRGAGDLHTY